MNFHSEKLILSVGKITISLPSNHPISRKLPPPSDKTTASSLARLFADCEEPNLCSFFTNTLGKTKVTYKYV